jgi:hypothetical protein
MTCTSHLICSSFSLSQEPPPGATECIAGHGTNSECSDQIVILIIVSLPPYFTNCECTECITVTSIFVTNSLDVGS